MLFFGWPLTSARLCAGEGRTLLQIVPKRAERALDLLGEAAGFETLFNRSDPSPWTGVELKDGEAVQNAVDLAGRLDSEILPGLSGLPPSNIRIIRAPAP
jgi:hypothetical protein